ncbi:MAG: helix-turn-helix domain-containing protein [Isosphaeraceae bacterium]
MATRTKSTSKAGPGGKKSTGRQQGRLSASTKTKSVATGNIDPAYLALIGRFSLRPIRTDAELDVASAIIDELTERDDLSPAESDYLDVLGDLVEKYEDEYVEMPHVSDGAMLRCLMEDKGVQQADIVRGTGISKTVLSLVQGGKRNLTREHIEALSKYFGVTPAVFLDS